MMKLFTIGFTKKTAEQFFTRLQNGGVRRLIDVRLNNSSQLAGFAKRSDLEYLLRAICGIEYLHLAELAPTQEMLDSYKKQTHDWERYESEFLSLLKQRDMASQLSREMFDGACLLCSEDKPEHCHRRLVAEFLKNSWGSIEIEHL